MRVSLRGEPLRPHSLLLSNHVSWLDIFVLGGTAGSAFVAKDELRRNAIIRWLADQNQTLYIDRSRRSDTQAQAAAVAEALHDARPLTIFPEGTVGPGDRLLPFRSALLSAVTPPPREVEVRPVAIDYGPAAAEISWVGESGKENFLRLLGRRGKLPVTLHLLAPIAHREDRKAVAREARQAIEQAFASSRSQAPLYAGPE